MRWGSLVCSAAFGCGGGSTGPMPDAGGETVEVLVMGRDPASSSGTVPAVGRTVVFAGAEGTIEAQTDSEGRATAAFAGGSVQVKNANNLGGTTILGVKPGDRLCVNGCAPRAGFPTYVRAPLDVDPYAGAAGYLFSHAGIEYDIGKSGTERADTMCPAPCSEPLDIYAIAVGDGLTMLAWTSAAAQPIVEGQPILLPGAWQPAEPFTGTIRNIPAGVFATAGRSSPPSRWEVRVSTPTPDLLMFGGPVANLTPTMLVVTQLQRTSPRQEQTVIASVPSAATYDLDASTELLPWITYANGSWTLSEGQPYDAVLIVYQQSLGDAPYSNVTFGPAGTPITMPAVLDGGYVVLIDRSDMDYDQLRQRDHRDADHRSVPPGATIRRSQASRTVP